MDRYTRCNRIPLALFVATLSACAPSTTVDRNAACVPGAAAPNSWQRVDAGPLSLQVPPGFEAVDVQGTDSRVGVFRKPNGAEITYDYGWYSNDLAPDPTRLTERVRCSETIGGHAATIVIGETVPQAGESRRYVVAAAWRNVTGGAQPSHLTLWSTTPDVAEADVLQAVLRSVRFD